MTIHNTIVFLLLFALTFAAPSIGAVEAQNKSETLVVVVSAKAPVSSISKADLQRIFLAQKVKLGGKTLMPFNPSAHIPFKQFFDSVVLGLSGSKLTKYWVDEQVRGRAGPPRAVPSVENLMKVVAKFPGAISFIPVSELTPDVKPLEIDGVKYTEPGYLLGGK